MNYPVWQLDAFGGGLLIAMMAVFHVYISHFAVGGGLFLVLTELKGIRENNRAIRDYAIKHTRFFLLVTMVAGGITGVGIWFTIALLNPAATSVLIHNFVFAWAAEWVFFTIEIIALLIYYYTYRRMEQRHHLMIGWIYFGAAWMSLFIINGIIDFMLTPGAWVSTHNFWDGFFNPTFWPALFFRTALCIIIAGLFGFMTATWIKDKPLRDSMVSYCARYLLIPFAVLLSSAWWYKGALPPDVETLIFNGMPEMQRFISGFILLSPILIIGGLLFISKIPGRASRPIAVIMLVLGLAYMGCFEFIREGGRRPYILRNHMYSNSLLQKDLARVRRNGLLKEAKWVQNKHITPANTLEAGREIYNILCLPCHSINGPLNNITRLSSIFSDKGLDALLSGVEKTHPYMPPFAGTGEERKALAQYISTTLNSKQNSDTTAEPAPVSVAVPAFDREKDTYVLLAWSDMGMRSMTDSSGDWLMLPPGQTLRATLILRGETPEIITDDVTLEYETARDFSRPAEQVDFWKNASSLLGLKIPVNTGLSGSKLSGVMQPGESSFTAQLLPLVPYTSAGKYQPYPTVSITARDTRGYELARTVVVAPIATELGCRNCHGGPWRVQSRAGISGLTAQNVLAAHDKLSGTGLVAQAAGGKPVLCQSCHSDSNGNHPGNDSQLNMSAAIHGFHANFLKGKGASACTSCHPASENGATRAYRGMHHTLEMDCTNCHGSLTDHALSLLKNEQRAGKKRAAVLAGRLQPEAVATVAEITPRKPWINEPDCLFCHVDFQAPEEDTTFNRWTDGEAALFRNRTDESGQLFCSGCHGSTHAIYPAINPANEKLDVIQPLQYQDNALPLGSNANCALCHTIPMQEEMHHPNMLREFRNL
ncbi:MAG: cytochrome C [Desulfobulbus sp.]|nr:MAG: cytochrome C [Desulfobulbus sp.]